MGAARPFPAAAEVTNEPILKGGHMPEQQPSEQAVEESPREEEQRQKTLAIRAGEGLHAQLRFIAQLSGSSLSDEIRAAIQEHVAAAHDNPELIARAQQARDEIEREAAARAAAIAGFIGKPAVAATTTINSPTRRGSRPVSPATE
jgi:hypothetical protein